MVAVLEGQPLDLGVYCANKLSPALREILEHTLSPSQLREFDTGDHRRVRAPFSRWVAPMRPPAARGSASLGWPTRPSGSPPGMSDGQDDWECRRCTLLNARPRRSCEVCGAPRGSGGKNDPKRQKHGAVKAPGGTVPKHQQLGLRQFAVVSAAQCIGCRAVLGSGGGSSEERGALCIGCSPRAAEIYLDKLRRHQEAEGRVASALAACGHCQSSGPGAEVLCANASCPKLYDRLEAVRQLHGSHAQLNLEW